LNRCNGNGFVFITSMDELFAPYITDYYVSKVISEDDQYVLGVKDDDPILGVKDDDPILGVKDDDPILGVNDDDPTPTESFRIYLYDEKRIRTCKEALHILQYYCQEMGCTPPYTEHIHRLYIMTTQREFIGYVLLTSDNDSLEVSAYVVPKRRNQGYLRRFIRTMSHDVSLHTLKFVAYVHLKNHAAVSAVERVLRTDASVDIKVVSQSRL